VLLTTAFGQHDIVNPLQGSRIAFVMPHSVRRNLVIRKTDTTKVAESFLPAKKERR